MGKIKVLQSSCKRIYEKQKKQTEIAFSHKGIKNLPKGRSVFKLDIWISLRKVIAYTAIMSIWHITEENAYKTPRKEKQNTDWNRWI